MGQRAISFTIVWARDCEMDKIAKADPLTEKDNRQTVAFNSGVNGVLFFPKFRGETLLEKRGFSTNANFLFRTRCSIRRFSFDPNLQDGFCMPGFRRVGVAEAQLKRRWSVNVMSRDLVYTSTFLVWGRGVCPRCIQPKWKSKASSNARPLDFSDKQLKSIVEKDTQPSNILKKRRPENHEKAGKVSNKDKPLKLGGPTHFAPWVHGPSTGLPRGM